MRFIVCFSCPWYCQAKDLKLENFWNQKHLSENSLWNLWKWPFKFVLYDLCSNKLWILMNQTFLIIIWFILIVNNLCIRNILNLNCKAANIFKIRILFVLIIVLKKKKKKMRCKISACWLFHKCKFVLSLYVYMFPHQTYN